MRAMPPFASPQTSTEAVCPPQAQHVIGGGFLSAGSPVAQGLSAIAATRPGPSLSAWQVWMGNYGETDFNVFARALCSAPL